METFDRFGLHLEISPEEGKLFKMPEHISDFLCDHAEDFLPFARASRNTRNEDREKIFQAFIRWFLSGEPPVFRRYDASRGRSYVFWFWCGACKFIAEYGRDRHAV